MRIVAYQFIPFLNIAALNEAVSLLSMREKLSHNPRGYCFISPARSSACVPWFECYFETLLILPFFLGLRFNTVDCRRTLVSGLISENTVPVWEISFPISTPPFTFPSPIEYFIL